MKYFKVKQATVYVASTKSQQQHPDDIVLLRIDNEVTSQKGQLKKTGKYTKNTNLTQKCYMEKQMSVTFTLSQCMRGD